MLQNSDIKFMDQAIELARKGIGFVNPNPMVGALIIKNDRILGMGYHEQYGGPHAEVNAFKNATEDVTGATLYVTLEPCNHFGKTPPCTQKIISEKIGRVVVATTDPNPKVNGKGIQQLRDAGIIVDILKNDIAKKATRLNEIYNFYIRTHQPFLAIKSAMTLDGKIATYRGQSRWITNEKSRANVHELRHQYAAIMVGVNTVIADDPSLTDRSDFKYKRHPLRVVVDSAGRTPLYAAVLDTEIAPTLLAVTEKASPKFIAAVEERGVEIMVCPEKDNKVDIRFLVNQLGKMNIDSILLEGGSTLNFSALEAGLVQKVYAFISPKLIGGKEAITPIGGKGYERMEQAITLNISEIHRFDEDIMIEAYIIK